MRRCDWYGFLTRAEMLDALCDGREDFVIVEDRGKRTEFVQIIREEDGVFFCEVAVDPGGGKDRKLLALNDPMTLRQVEAFLDRFESGEKLSPLVENWEEVNWQWREEDSPSSASLGMPQKEKESLMGDEAIKKVVLLLVAVLLAAILIIIEWNRF